MVKQKFLAWGPVIGYCLLIFYISSLSHPLNLKLNYFPHMDKVIHFFEFAVLSLLVARAVSLSFAFSSRGKLILLCIFFTTLYGVGDEIHQMFVPYRSPDVFDIMADGFGAVVGQWLYFR